jgi:hypothetical protein
LILLFVQTVSDTTLASPRELCGSSQTPPRHHVGVAARAVRLKPIASTTRWWQKCGELGCRSVLQELICCVFSSLHVYLTLHPLMIAALFPFQVLGFFPAPHRVGAWTARHKRRTPFLSKVGARLASFHATAVDVARQGGSPSYEGPTLFVNSMPAWTLENDDAPTPVCNSDAFVNTARLHTHAPLECSWYDSYQHWWCVRFERSAALLPVRTLLHQCMRYSLAFVFPNTHGPRYRFAVVTDEELALSLRLPPLGVIVRASDGATREAPRSATRACKQSKNITFSLLGYQNL